jgi:subtilisin family serine protease
LGMCSGSHSLHSKPCTRALETLPTQPACHETHCPPPKQPTPHYPAPPSPSPTALLVYRYMSAPLPPPTPTPPPPQHPHPPPHPHTQTHSAQAHALCTGTGAGVTVYVIDSGIRPNHQEFKNYEGTRSRASFGECSAHLPSCSWRAPHQTHTRDLLALCIDAACCMLHASLDATAVKACCVGPARLSSFPARPCVSFNALTGFDFVEDDKIAEDCDGHGTHVAATVSPCPHLSFSCSFV